MYQGSLSHLSPVLKLISLLLLVITFGSLAGFVLTYIGDAVFEVDMTSRESIRSNVPFMQTSQMVQSISLFVIPPLIGFYLFYNKFKEGIQGSGHTSVRILILTIALVLLSQVFITFSGWLNHQLALPDGFQHVLDWVISKEDQARQYTIIMIRSNSWQQVLITLIMISVIPAIGEEWVFRGIIQRELSVFFKNSHVAIFITAILFSAIHMQFLTFLPRFLIGLILGYLFLYSRNLWMPILAHFTNNFMATVVYMYMTSKTGQSPLEMPSNNPFGISVILSFCVIPLFLYLTKRIGSVKGGY